MAYETLLTEIGADGVGLITLNRPDQFNTFNTTLAVELDQALWQMEADESVRVVILKGAGRGFCAGIDLAEFSGKTVGQYKDWVEKMEQGLQTILSMGKPVIAQVHGVAAANGAGLVAAADLAVAAEEARIGYTAINVGLFCLGPAVPLSLAVGRKQALELLYFGDLIPAGRAYEMGLVNLVVGAGELEAITRQLAAQLAAKSPYALQLGKRACHVTGAMEPARAFDYMNEAFARLCASEDAREGVAAFMEKR
ncbi:MAG: enoyl-CoA hydratase/isomerase family protein, partial [Deltaproteobacteria bacterium]|nr:enoyl-CoA hydratase/isomerase family protein [Deltaproteobacteria bacterium]